MMLIGLFLLLSYVAVASTDAALAASAYFPQITAKEKEAYTNWLADRSSNYSRHAFLSSLTGDNNNGAAIFWSIDNNETIHVAIAVRAEGWVGFGISEAGGMLGSDIAIYETSTLTLTDSYVLEDRAAPLIDNCQDWKLNSAAHNGDGWIIVEMSRLLDTNDAQDHAIQNDSDLWTAPSRIIAAWGDTESISYHGTNVARSPVRLFYSISNVSELQLLTRALEEQSDGYFDIREDDYEIPARETTYHSVCKTLDELNLEISEDQNMLTAIGMVPVITEETAQFVHHFLVYIQNDCSDNGTMQQLQQSLITGWAPGDIGLVLPDDVGFPIFDTDNSQAVYIEIHYNNPQRIRSMKDSSGMRIHYTYSKREHEAAILQIGDPFVQLYGQQINSGLTQYQFNCPSTCSSQVLGNQKVTVLMESLHMHQTGIRMKNEIIRDGSVTHTAQVDVFDFDQQGTFRPQQDTFDLLPGDSFQTTCYYRDGAKFGTSSNEEMCIAYLMYYPKKTWLGFTWACPYNTWSDQQALTGCLQTELTYSDITSADQLGRTFGGSSSECYVAQGAGIDLLPMDSPSEAPTKTPTPIPLELTSTSSTASTTSMVFTVPITSTISSTSTTSTGDSQTTDSGWSSTARPSKIISHAAPNKKPTAAPYPVVATASTTSGPTINSGLSPTSRPNKVVPHNDPGGPAPFLITETQSPNTTEESSGIRRNIIPCLWSFTSMFLQIAFL